MSTRFSWPHRPFGSQVLFLDENGRLTIPWSPRWRPWLRLEAGGARLGTRTHELLLPWDALDPSRSNGWMVDLRAASGSDLGHITVQGHGDHVPVIGAFRREVGATRAGLLVGRRSVLLRRGLNWRELGLLTALFDLLAERPRARQALSDPQRTRTFIVDVAVWSGRFTLGHGTSFPLRDRTDVRVALELLGYRHSHGRPIPGDPMPAADEVLDAVLAALAANPYRRGRQTPRADVDAAVRAYYLDVEPWPFSALVR